MMDRERIEYFHDEPFDADFREDYVPVPDRERRVYVPPDEHGVVVRGLVIVGQGLWLLLCYVLEWLHGPITFVLEVIARLCLFVAAATVLFWYIADKDPVILDRALLFLGVSFGCYLLARLYEMLLNKMAGLDD